jgi:leucine dehydrogenase
MATRVRDRDAHEQVLSFHDPATGLHGVVAIHDRTLGPAMGGCRMWPYADEAAAMRDAMRLSRGMTFKNAMAGLPIGGGKAVIIGDPRTDKSEALFRAFGRFVHTLQGRYVTAEDVGVSVQDMEWVRKETPHVAGLRGASGDPSPLTARGVFVGIQTAVRHRLGANSLRGIRVAVQGLGHVGSHLCRELHQAGASMIVSDIHQDAVGSIVEQYDAVAVAPDAILGVEADVLAPCALGAVIHDRSIADLRVAIVAGAANNQLESERHGEALRQRGVLYAPDYVINAGGIINAASELEGPYDRDRVLARVEGIAGTLDHIFARAHAEHVSPAEVADILALERLRAARRTAA